MKKEENKNIFIYGLFNDENETIRYVGKTNKINKRLKEHIKYSYLKKTHKDRWIHKSLTEGKEIKIKILEITTEEDWKEKEVYWINYYNENSPENKKLTNIAVGGFGGCGSKYELSYEEVKKWVKENLEISSGTKWEKYCKKNNLPDFIPVSPREVYLNRGWISWGDFLGTGRISDNFVNYITYDEAKLWMKENMPQIDSDRKFKESAKNNLIPNFIPNRPERYYKYKNRGWINWGDFLNTGRIQNQLKIFLTYEEAKKYTLKLNLKTTNEWKRLKNKPTNIPSLPELTYKNKGWVNWSDFLGTEIISDNELHENFLKIDECKDYVKNNLSFIKSSIQWKKYLKENDESIPKTIPRNPELSYKNKGWKNWGDFLETGNVMYKDKVFLNFENCKLIIQSFNLKTNKDFRVFILNEGKNKGIPSAPDKKYKNEGWKGWGDFLGTNRVANKNKKLLNSNENNVND